MSSEEEIYRSSYEELRQTVESQREAYERINQLAVDLAKIDLLTISAVLAGVSVSGLSLSLPLVVGLLTFVYALWCCIQVYEPLSFPHGIGVDAVEEIDESVRDGMEVQEHYRRLMFSYSETIFHLTGRFSAARAKFRHALWASVTTIVLFAFVAFRRLLPSHPLSIDVVVVVAIAVVVHWTMGDRK